MNKELFEKFVALAKEKGFAPNLDEVNIDKAKKIEQEIFTNIDNAINWYYKFYPAKTDDEKDNSLTAEFKRNKTKKAIQELIKRIENKSTIEEARIILEDFNFTLPENKTKKELYNLIALFIFNKFQKLLQKPLTTIITYCII